MNKDIYGLVGKKLSHSFSQKYFSQKFKDLNINASYLNFEIDSIDKIKDVLLTDGLKGFNVTIPYKEEILPFLDEIDESAKVIGAVNTVKIINSKIKGFNTDVFGFKQMIKPFFENHHERAIILGTGGASKSVAFVLKELGCKPIFISRNPQLDNHFSYADINEIMVKNCPIIINTSPVGMYPNEKECPIFPFEYLTSKNLVIDLIYNPIQTEFLKKSKEKGANTINGLTMLHQQAEKAWEIWEG